MKQLVKFEKDWADEFTLEAFTVVNDYKEVEKLFAIAEIYFEVFGELELYFGTNEYITFDDYKDYRNSFEVSNITDDEANVFQKYFYYYLPENPPEFGTGIEAFDQNTFYDEFFNPENKDKLSDAVIERLKKIEPEFETWMNLNE
jgi:hypothetical protein